MSLVTSSNYTLPDNAVWFSCSSGIGKALSQLIASKPQHRLVSTARDISSLSYLPDSHPNVLKLSLDVTSQPSVDAAISATFAKFGRLDVFVNNAGYTLYGDAENASEEDSRRVVETDFWGMVRVTKHALRILREENPKTGQQGGLIMNVSSMGGRIGFPGNAFYHASKFAMEGFTEAVQKEVRPEWNIHFCLVEPGGVQTNYATTSTQKIAVHPAYAAEDTPARVLERYIDNPEYRKTWAKAEEVVEAMYKIADAKGNKVPLRVPLGPDAWGMMKAEFGRMEEELEAVKPISTAVGHKDQLESIEFLKTLE
ncbi:short-chain dehydrogenase [Coniochaeta sp. 2T2.1]|nr:short-chain dehydrogenase [Coniochaeta sp. 2T2.1]